MFCRDDIRLIAVVVSLIGVVLIARPPFIFDAIRVGRENDLSLRAFRVDAAKLVTTRERMVAVGHVPVDLNKKTILTTFINSVALLGVAAVTCECKSPFEMHNRL